MKIVTVPYKKNFRSLDCGNKQRPSRWLSPLPPDDCLVALTEPAAFMNKHDRAGAVCLQFMRAIACLLQRELNKWRLPGSKPAGDTPIEVATWDGCCHLRSRPCWHRWLNIFLLTPLSSWHFDVKMFLPHLLFSAIIEAFTTNGSASW